MTFERSDRVDSQGLRLARWIVSGSIASRLCGLSQWFNRALDLRCLFDFGDAQIVRSLKVKPGSGIAAEAASEAHCGVWGYTTTLEHDVVQARRGNTQPLSERINAHV
jgi:hypothetical protein